MKRTVLQARSQKFLLGGAPGLNDGARPQLGASEKFRGHRGTVPSGGAQVTSGVARVPPGTIAGYGVLSIALSRGANSRIRGL